MTPEQIYKANISHSHEAALDAVFNAGVTIGMGKMAEAVIGQQMSVEAQAEEPEEIASTPAKKAKSK